MVYIPNNYMNNIMVYIPNNFQCGISFIITLEKSELHKNAQQTNFFYRS